jgi:uncharacterized protein
MKKLPVFLFVTLMAISIHCQLHAQGGKPHYDKSLADSLGADDYGMKQYVLVILKTGKRENVDKMTQDSLFAGHMKNIGRLADAGKLIVAGPMQKNEKAYRGIFILNVQTLEEAAALVDTDPAIKGGLLEPELYGWYGSAALPLYLKYHPQLQKKNF